jgi:hypothetical protein
VEKDGWSGTKYTWDNG